MDIRNQAELKNIWEQYEEWSWAGLIMREKCYILTRRIVEWKLEKKWEAEEDQHQGGKKTIGRRQHGIEICNSMEKQKGENEERFQ